MFIRAIATSSAAAGTAPARAANASGARIARPRPAMKNPAIAMNGAAAETTVTRPTMPDRRTDGHHRWCADAADEEVAAEARDQRAGLVGAVRERRDGLGRVERVLEIDAAPREDAGVGGIEEENDEPEDQDRAPRQVEALGRQPGIVLLRLDERRRRPEHDEPDHDRDDHQRRSRAAGRSRRRPTRTAHRVMPPTDHMPWKLAMMLRPYAFCTRTPCMFMPASTPPTPSP